MWLVLLVPSGLLGRSVPFPRPATKAVKHTIPVRNWFPPQLCSLTTVVEEPTNAPPCPRQIHIATVSGTINHQ
ncbi:hypothetical protein EDB81DRAFT_801993 [Dactylonectria macrodidyma]|uniref:Secreted protein n=1 Tax=Dactylonectria macrodidyma TaxID=307937 RepID=A0A9P9EFX7_9HYPO|nr:hypothetical protein EDB81DRAFT_801993 [Dactylonectria macrodidyma]